jgi:hypothetical protein
LSIVDLLVQFLNKLTIARSTIARFRLPFLRGRAVRAAVMRVRERNSRTGRITVKSGDHAIEAFRPG